MKCNQTVRCATVSSFSISPMRRVKTDSTASRSIAGPQTRVSGSDVVAASMRTVIRGFACSIIPSGEHAWPSQACALTQLAVLKRELGSLDRVAEVLTLNGYVNAAQGFHDSPAVINGASELLGEIFGDAGAHARSAVGVAELPLGAPVEVELIVEVN